MANYTVFWSTNVNANSPQEAAAKAKELIQTKDGNDKRFEVFDTASGVRMDVKVPDPVA